MPSKLVKAKLVTAKAAPLSRPTHKTPSAMALPAGATREFHPWGKTCKYCGRNDLRWVAIVDGVTRKWILEERAATPSGVQTHKCPEYNRTVERVQVEIEVHPAPETNKTPDNYGDW